MSFHGVIHVRHFTRGNAMAITFRFRPSISEVAFSGAIVVASVSLAMRPKPPWLAGAAYGPLTEIAFLVFYFSIRSWSLYRLRRGARNALLRAID